MKKLSILLVVGIGILLNGCAGQQYTEQRFKLPEIELRCYYNAGASSNTDIRRGKAVAEARKIGGRYVIDMPCTKKNNRFTADDEMLGHEIREILWFRDKWQNPDAGLRLRQRPTTSFKFFNR